MRTRPIPHLSEKVKARFAGYHDNSPAGCWIWNGSVHPRGYGRFHINRKTYQAHRVAFAIANGPIPDGLVVCHSCDNPPCVNPAHLWAGTQDENIKDCVAKGRTNGGAPGKPSTRPFRYVQRAERKKVVFRNSDGSVATCKKCGHLRTDDYQNGRTVPSRCANCQQARDYKKFLARRSATL